MPSGMLWPEYKRRSNTYECVIASMEDLCQTPQFAQWGWVCLLVRLNSLISLWDLSASGCTVASGVFGETSTIVPSFSDRGKRAICRNNIFSLLEAKNVKNWGTELGNCDRPGFGIQLHRECRHSEFSQELPTE